jgi:hypothetical protein
MYTAAWQFFWIYVNTNFCVKFEGTVSSDLCGRWRESGFMVFSALFMTLLIFQREVARAKTGCLEVFVRLCCALHFIGALLDNCPLPPAPPAYKKPEDLYRREIRENSKFACVRRYRGSRPGNTLYAPDVQHRHAWHTAGTLHVFGGVKIL